MATLTIEGIPPGLLIRLAKAAVANGRCVNSEAILSLVRHVREGAPGQDFAGTGAIACHPGPRNRSEVPPGLNVSWGDPG
jgi:hypothetical protein